MEELFVVGVGMTPFGNLPGTTVKQMTALAVRDALADADVDASAIEAAFFANACQGHVTGQHMIRGQVALRPLGFVGIPVINVENACAGGASALHMAVAYLRSGAAEVALAVGAEQMITTDKALALSIFAGAWDVDLDEENRERLVALGAGIDPPPGSTSSKPYSVFMDVYAGFARDHMKRFGTTQRQLASVAAKNHQHSAFNQRAQFRRTFSVEEVLAAPPIVYPLTLPMCAPVSNGAAAAIVATAKALRRLGIAASRACRIRASVLRTGSDRPVDAIDRHCTALAARAAYQQAGIGPDDISVAEVHDATAMGEIIQIENLGFVDFGEGGPASERGETRLGGRLPVNPSGGLESKGHPIGATGLAQIFEIATQLRGEAGKRQVENARIGIAENGGGLHGIEEAVAAISVLERGT